VVTRMIFSRSIFIGLVFRLVRFFGYRPVGSTALIFLAVLLLLPCACSWADDSDDWPEPVYFPQTQTQPTASQPTPEKKNTPDKASPKEKKGIWPFKRKDKQAVGNPQTEEQSKKSGPKDPPASPFPLVRLAMPIQADTGIIAPGIYLVKPAEEADKPDSPTPDGGKTVYLTRQNKIMVKLVTHLVKPVDENMAVTGTSSPLTKVDPKAPPVLSVEAKLSTDLKTIIFIVKEGEQRFESAPFPVATDQRRLLTF